MRILGSILMFALVTSTVYAVEKKVDDQYLRGYLAAVLERELHWDLSLIDIEIQNGKALLRVPTKYYDEREKVAPLTTPITGLKGVEFVIKAESVPPAAQTTESTVEKLGLTTDQLPLPATNLFRPLIADPKEPYFYASYRNYELDNNWGRIAAVGFGEHFGFYRQRGKNPGDGLQIGISAAVFAQFNLDAPSADLINADYIVGFPLTYRRGPLSMRARIYHQSSHLGDEFLLRVQPQRVNFSYESAEFLVSYDFWRNWRIYGGGEYLFHREPSELKPRIFHAGVEYRSDVILFKDAYFIGGIDIKRHEEHNWAHDFSTKFGLQFGRDEVGQRNIRLLAELFKGYSPHGQFYNQRTRYYGLQLGFGF